LANPFLYILSSTILFIFPPKEDKESEESEDSIDLKTENIRQLIPQSLPSPLLKIACRRKTEVGHFSIVNKIFPPFASAFTNSELTFEK